QRSSPSARPFRTALVMPQEHFTFLTEKASRSEDADSVVGFSATAARTCFNCPGTGLTNAPPHLRHLPWRPARWSGILSSTAHFGHLNLMTASAEACAVTS